MIEETISQLETDPGFWIGVVSRKMIKYYKRKLMPYSLSVQQFFILLYLWENEISFSKDIAVSMPFSSNGICVAGTLYNLENLGYIERKKDPQDGRKTIVFLTKEGKKLKKTIHPLGDQIKTTLKMGAPKLTFKRFEKCMDMIDKHLE